MRLTICIILIISFTVSEIFANEINKIDSLKNELNSAKEDTTKVILLKEIGLNLLRSNPDESKERALEALELSKRLNYPKGVAAAFNLLALNEEHRGNYAKTIDYYIKALKIIEKENDKENIANLY